MAVAYAGLAVYVVAVAPSRAGWRRARSFTSCWAPASGHARALLVRFPHIATLFIFQICMLRAFGVAVPVVRRWPRCRWCSSSPSLPISVQGLGTTQAAMVYFFARYAAGDIRPSKPRC